MDKALLFDNKLDYYTDNRYDYYVLAKMIIHHFEGARKGFFDTLVFLNLWDCQYNHVIGELHRHNNPDDAINYLQELPLTDEQKHVLYGFILLRACRGNPGNINGINDTNAAMEAITKAKRITFKRIEKMFLAYPCDTPEKTYCTEENAEKAIRIHKDTPPEYFGDFIELISWFERRPGYRFVNLWTIERRFDSWLEDNEYYAAVGTDEYKRYLTVDRFKQFIAECPDVIAAKQEKQTDTTAMSQTETVKHPEPGIKKEEWTKQYDFDMGKVAKIYEFCIDTVISNSITKTDFINAIVNADFADIYRDAEQKKAKGKCKYIVFVLNYTIKEHASEWYLKAAHSINTEPTKCSGINVPDKWKKQADKLK
jgi:hypothetical protein